MKLGVVGKGIVGSAVALGFQKKGHSILIYDKYKESDPLEKVVLNSEIIFICVPTPSNGDGSIDLSAVRESAQKINKIIDNIIIVIKSTVIPGTTNMLSKEFPKLKFVCNPETLDEDKALEHFLKPFRIMVGSRNTVVLEKMEALYKDFDCPKFFTINPTAVELIKYAANSFYALKVVFANQIYDLSEKLNVDYDFVKLALMADRYIGKNHLEVWHKGSSGTKPGRGAGGHCLKKDLAAFITLSDSLGYGQELLKKAQELNNEYLKESGKE